MKMAPQASGGVLGVGAAAIVLLALGARARHWWRSFAAQRTRATAGAQGKPGRAARRKALRIFFGSETGKAEAFAHELGSEARRRGVDAFVESLAHWRGAVLAIPAEDEPNAALHETELLVLLIATHGEGEPPADARDFCLALKSGLVELRGSFAVFGLGHHAYQHFNAVAKRVDRRLARVAGARRAMPLALGDDGGNLRADFVAWQRALWRELEVDKCASGVGERCGFELVYVPPDKAGGHALPLRASQGVTLLDRLPTCQALALAVGPPGDKLHSVGAHTAGVLAAAPAHGRSERLLVRLQLPAAFASSLDVGDHLGIWPRNPPVVVAQLATRLRLRLSALAVLRAPRTPQKSVDGVAGLAEAGEQAPSNGAATAVLASPTAGADTGADGFEYRFECPCTVRDMLSRHLDVMAPLSPAVLRLLAESCVPPRSAAAAAAKGGAAEQGSMVAQRQRLLLLCEGGAEYAEWAAGPQSGLNDALAAFACAQPEAGPLFALLPRLQPRYFSLASDPRSPPQRAQGPPLAELPGGRNPAVEACGAAEHVAVSLLVTLQRLPAGRLGVCSAHLEMLKAGRDTLTVFARSSNFKPPAAGVPLVMVAVGSGLAPFLGFLERRAAILAGRCAQHAEAGAAAGARLGEAHIYYGCRTEAEVPHRQQLGEWLHTGAADGAERASAGGGGGQSVLSSCQFAYSRPGHPAVSRRVQQLLTADGKRLARLLLHQGACVCVCGSGGMAASVREAFKGVLRDEGALEERAAAALLLQLQQAGRYQQDVWG